MSLLVRAMVTHPDDVSVVAVSSIHQSEAITITVAEGLDKGIVIGKGGRNARALRIILQTIAHRHGRVYLLGINGTAITAT